MGDDTEAIDTVAVDDLRVPESLIDLVEKWAYRVGAEPADVLRSILNLGLAHYVQVYPRSTPRLLKAMNDLEAMAPEGSQRCRLDARVQDDGHLTLHQADVDDPDVVTFEVAARPKLAALLRAHANRAMTMVSTVLVETWCTATLEHYYRTGNTAMAAATLDAWREQGIPDYIREEIERLTEITAPDGVSPIQ